MVNKYCVGESRWNKEKVTLAKLTSHLVSSFLSQIEKGNLDQTDQFLTEYIFLNNYTCSRRYMSFHDKVIGKSFCWHNKRSRFTVEKYKWEEIKNEMKTWQEKKLYRRISLLDKKNDKPWEPISTFFYVFLLYIILSITELRHGLNVCSRKL